MANLIARKLEKLFFGSVGGTRTIQNAVSLSPTDQEVIDVFDEVFSPPRATISHTFAAATGSIDLSTARNFVISENYSGNCAITLTNPEEGVLYTFTVLSLDGNYSFTSPGVSFTFGITPSVNGADVIQFIVFGLKGYWSAFAQNL